MSEENKSNANKPKGPTTYTRGSNIPTPTNIPKMPNVNPPKESSSSKK